MQDCTSVPRGDLRSDDCNFVSPRNFEKLGSRVDAVCRIYFKDNPIKGGSGFLIGPGIILTNNHVIRNKEEAEKAKAQFFYEEGKNPVEVMLNPHEEKGGWFFCSDFPEKGSLDQDHLDFTIVALEGNSKLTDVYKNAFSLFSEAVPKEGQRANIIQHPVLKKAKEKSSFKQLAIRKNKVTHVVRAKCVVHYTTKTRSGSSGSPVMDDEGNLFAVHEGECEEHDKEYCNKAILIEPIADKVTKAGYKEKIQTWRLAPPLMQKQTFAVVSSKLVEKKAKEAEKAVEDLLRMPDYDFAALASAQEKLRKAFQGLDKACQPRSENLQNLDNLLRGANFDLSKKRCLPKTLWNDDSVEMLAEALDQLSICNEEEFLSFVADYKESTAYEFCLGFYYETIGQNTEACQAYYKLGRSYLEDPSAEEICQNCIQKGRSLEDKKTQEKKKTLIRQAFQSLLQNIAPTNRPLCYIHYLPHDKDSESWIEKYLLPDLNALNCQRFYAKDDTTPGRNLVHQMATEIEKADYVFIASSKKLVLVDKAYNDLDIISKTGRAGEYLASRLADPDKVKYSTFPFIIQGEGKESKFELTAVEAEDQLARNDEEYHRTALGYFCAIAKAESKVEVNVQELSTSFEKYKGKILLDEPGIEAEIIEKKK